MYVRKLAIYGLGHLSAFVADEATGAATVADRRRGVDIYLDAARGLGLWVTSVLEAVDTRRGSVAAPLRP